MAVFLKFVINYCAICKVYIISLNVYSTISTKNIYSKLKNVMKHENQCKYLSMLDLFHTQKTLENFIIYCLKM